MAKKKAKKKVAKKKVTKKKVTKKKVVAKGDPLIVASKVKAYIKSKGLLTASDSLPAINAKVCALIDEAAERTVGNKRSTLKPQDL